jgi:hypothetical protein
VRFGLTSSGRTGHKAETRDQTHPHFINFDAIAEEGKCAFPLPNTNLQTNPHSIKCSVNTFQVSKNRRDNSIVSSIPESPFVQFSLTLSPSLHVEGPAVRFYVRIQATNDIRSNFPKAALTNTSSFPRSYLLRKTRPKSESKLAFFQTSLSCHTTESAILAAKHSSPTPAEPPYTRGRLIV